jgi:hypothetical protein
MIFPLAELLDEGDDFSQRPDADIGINKSRPRKKKPGLREEPGFRRMKIGVDTRHAKKGLEALSGELTQSQDAGRRQIEGHLMIR